MKTLNFHRAWIEPILTGAKTMTLRARNNLQPGEVAAGRCLRQGPPFALLEVLSVRELERSAVDPAVAESERIARIYPDADRLFEISFRRLPE